MLNQCWICGKFCNPDDANDNAMRVEESGRCFCSKHLEEGFAQVLISLGFTVLCEPKKDN